ncbi:hypothetical protein [Stenotrophomonas rhizophila]|uniref:hypothetical protein n=1 Tax=Stenotrophomonas rhizophila TaxID=216778 RepID=UPI001FD3F232|nr:hypothetical protein [Stenotrophomonas rhizophila]
MMQTVNQELNPWHRRQAALLYHFASMPYLRGLLEQINQLIGFTDEILEDRGGLDAAGRSLANWQPADTAGHFSTHAFPALVDFKEKVIRAIAARSYERYSEAGERQCSRMLQEYAFQMIWATGEQEASFQSRAEAVFKYAGNISRMMRRPTTWNDFVFSLLWEKNRQDFPRIPCFRVRTDIECVSGQTPPRTGVYVPQDDPMGALQFGWTGGYGELGDTYTLNDFGKIALERVGRAGLWSDESGLHALINEPQHRHLPKIDDSDRARVDFAPAAVALQGFEGRPCKWYFVELLDGEYEDHDGSYTGLSSFPSSTRPHRVAGGELVPQSGWWYTPAKMGSTRYFKKEDRFPHLDGNEFGTTFWIWSPDQSAPKLG